MVGVTILDGIDNCLTYTKMESERGVMTECAYSTTVGQNKWRQNVVETLIILPNVGRGNVF